MELRDLRDLGLTLVQALVRAWLALLLLLASGLYLTLSVAAWLPALGGLGGLIYRAVMVSTWVAGAVLLLDLVAIAVEHWRPTMRRPGHIFRHASLIVTALAIIAIGLYADYQGPDRTVLATLELAWLGYALAFCWAVLDQAHDRWQARREADRAAADIFDDVHRPGTPAIGGEQWPPPWMPQRPGTGLIDPRHRD